MHRYLDDYKTRFKNSGRELYRSERIDLIQIEIEDGRNIKYFSCAHGNFRRLDNVLHAIDKRWNRL